MKQAPLRETRQTGSNAFWSLSPGGTEVVYACEMENMRESERDEGNYILDGVRAGRCVLQHEFLRPKAPGKVTAHLPTDAGGIVGIVALFSEWVDDVQVYFFKNEVVSREKPYKKTI